jgi:hypothetical protein
MALVCASLTMAFASAGLCDESLIANGELTQGSGSMPDHWRPESMRNLSYAEDAATFQWSHDPGSAEMWLFDKAPNRTSWGQTLTLAPGWYFLHGEMRTEPAALHYGSALIGVHLETGTIGLAWSDSPTQDWYKGGLYFSVGARARTVEIVCVLVGKGRAFFRHLGLSRLSAPPPPNVGQVVDLDSLPEPPSRPLRFPDPTAQTKPFGAPTGRPWSIFALMLVLSVVAFSGWLALGVEDHPQP